MFISLKLVYTRIKGGLVTGFFKIYSINFGIQRHVPLKELHWPEEALTPTHVMAGVGPPTYPFIQENVSVVPIAWLYGYSAGVIALAGAAGGVGQ